MLRQRAGMRPNEMLGVRACDVVSPEQQDLAGRGACVIGLGLRVGAKAKRAQSVILFEHKDPDVIEAVRRVIRASAADSHLFPILYHATVCGSNWLWGVGARRSDGPRTRPERDSRRRAGCWV